MTDNKIIDNFNENGAIYLKSVYNIEVIELFNKDIREFLTNNKIYEHIRKKNDVTEDNFFVNNTYISLDNYKKMQYYPKVPTNTPAPNGGCKY